jgi:hypothetical protein
MEKLLAEIIFQQLDEPTGSWLKEKAIAIHSETAANQLYQSFAMLPRKTGKHPITISTAQEKELSASLPGFSVSGWSIDRLSRVWLLQQINSTDQATFTRKIEQLFLTAEMNELVALYSSLPLLAYPESWKHRCTEGIRSNIALVLEAIMYENPYPEKWLDEGEWNQMVLKAFFTDKNIDRITGIDRRANLALANTLFDYAHERWQAGRNVNPQLWRLVQKFISQDSFADLQKLYKEGNAVEKKAAILACSQSEFEPAKQFAEQAPEISIVKTQTTWSSLITEALQHSNN